MKKILIIEDEEPVFSNYVILIELIAKELDVNFEVLPQAKSFDEAKESLKLNPDIIFLDNWLNENGRSGIDLFLEFIAQIPIYTVFITAQDKVGTLKMLIDKAVEVIDKPIGYEHLKKILQNYLSLSNKLNFKEKLKKDYESLIRKNKDFTLKLLKFGTEEVNPLNIVFIKSDSSGGKYCTIIYFAESKRSVSSIYIKDWEKKLNDCLPNYFFKIGSNCIVNKLYIDSLISPNVIRFKEHMILHPGTEKMVEVSKDGYSDFVNRFRR